MNSRQRKRRKSRIKPNLQAKTPHLRGFGLTKVIFLGYYLPAFPHSAGSQTPKLKRSPLKPSSLIIEIRIHAGSGAYNNAHGNIERAVVNAIKSVGHPDPRVDIVHYKKGIGIGKVVVHQRILDAGTQPVIGAGERTKAMEARIERELRKIIGAMPGVRFTRDAEPAPCPNHGQMKQYYARPNPGRNPAANGRSVQARM